MIELQGYPATLVKSSDDVLGELDEWRFVDTLLRNVDPEQTLKIPSGSSLFVRGWTLLDNPPRAARGVLVTFTEKVWFEAAYGKPRQDIATAYGEAGVGNSGYAGIGKLLGLPLGTHEFVVAVLGDGNGYFELARQRFELIPSKEQIARLTRAAEGRVKVSLDDIATLRDPAAFDGKTLRAKIGDVLYLRGWALDLETQTGLTGVFGVIDDEEYVVGVHGLPRDDVAAAFSTPRAHKSGFTLRIPTQALKPGAHKLGVAVVAADRHSYATHPVANLELTDR
jgi:hypothetical protein